MNNNNNVPATRAKKSHDLSTVYDTTASGVHVHMGAITADSETYPSSLSCLTIYPADYSAFAMAVGFIREANKVKKGDPFYPVHGAIVMDRSLITNK